MARTFEQSLTNALKSVLKDIEQASATSLNEAAKSAIAAGIAVITSKYSIKKSELSKSIKMNYARKNKQSVEVTIKDIKLPLIKFSARPTPRPKKYKTGKAGGTRVRVEKGKSVLYKHAFVQWKASGDKTKQVFIRTDKGDSSKIIPLYGPQVLGLWLAKEVQSVITSKFIETYNKRLDHNLKRVK